MRVASTPEFARRLSSVGRGGLARISRAPRGPLWIGAVCALALLVALFVWGRGAVGDDHAQQARPVPQEQLPFLLAAGTSCPALSPARLAAQIMAASGFDPQAHTPDGATGLAGLTEPMWQAWQPWPDAARTDPEANIVAMAHLTCDLIGQVRELGARDDPWRLAMAARKTDLATVRAAGGIPGPAAEYVNLIDGYAAWYATDPGLAVAATASGAPAAPVRGAPAVPIPDAFLPAIVSAGTRCPVITPARIAAQLMASSGFNASLVGPSGTQGIAQFRPDIWARFSTPAASAWQPLNSIAVLGQAMCTLVSEAADSGDDPYRVALAQFRAGTAQASHTGATLAAAADYVDMVVDYITVYEGDPRLSSQSTTSPASPTPARTPPRTSDPGAMPGATPGAISSTPVPPAITPKPTASTTQPPTPPAAVAIVGYVGKCIDVTDRASVDGTPLQMWTCNAASNQKWTFMADGTVRSLGKCMDVAWGSPDNGTTIQLANCSGNPAQRFTLNTAGDLVSLLVHKCVDVRDRSTANGARLQIWECAGTANQKWHRG